MRNSSFFRPEESRDNQQLAYSVRPLKHTHQSIVREMRERAGNSFKRNGSASRRLCQGTRYCLPEMSIWFQRQCQTTASQLENILSRTLRRQEKTATRIRNLTLAHDEIQEVDEIPLGRGIATCGTPGRPGEDIESRILCRSPGASTATPQKNLVLSARHQEEVYR